jgi:hypothetical protein
MVCRFVPSKVKAGRNVNDKAPELYPIQEYDYEVGICADGRQVVMGLLCPYLTAFFFDPQGSLLEKERRLWNHPAPWQNGCYNIYDTDFEAALIQQKSDWQSEIGFQPGLIRVKAFFDDEDTVGIEPLPEHYLNLETPDEFEDEEERQEWIRDRDAWLERGDFVWWARDYYMNSNGEVEST